MSRIAIFFASQDGQTRKIAHYLSQQIDNHGGDAFVVDLDFDPHVASGLFDADVVVVLAAIRYGYPLKSAEAFLKSQERVLSRKSLVMLSVNLTARKPEKRSIDNSVYLQKWVARHPFKPKLVAAIAGKLDYPSYGWFDKMMIRLIMTMTKGPTDPHASIEFTDWEQVNDLADQIARLA